MTHDQIIAELDALLGAPDGSELELTPEQVERVGELKAMLNPTPIEIIAAALDIHGVDEILVPEQCLIVYIDDKPYHLTLEPMPE